MRDYENCLSCDKPLPESSRVDRMYCSKACVSRRYKQIRRGKVIPDPVADPVAILAKMSDLQRGWVAGIIEGEGSISTTQTMRIGNLYVYPLITVGMTDEDMVRRLRDWTGLGRFAGPFSPPSRGSNKPNWRWSVNKIADVEALIDAIWPLLGERRRQQATALRQKISERTLKRGC